MADTRREWLESCETQHRGWEGSVSILMEHALRSGV